MASDHLERLTDEEYEEVEDLVEEEMKSSSKSSQPFCSLFTRYSINYGMSCDTNYTLKIV